MTDAAAQPSRQKLTVNLPAFVVLALRELARRESLSVSFLLETWLLEAITLADVNSIASESPEFKRAAESWLNARR